MVESSTSSSRAISPELPSGPGVYKEECTTAGAGYCDSAAFERMSLKRKVDQEAPAENLPRGLQFEFEPKPEEHSALYLKDPARSTASCNAGDYRLYVGGGAINRAFGALFKKEHGLQFGKISEDYQTMHVELLEASRKAGRKLMAAKDVPQAAELLPKLCLAAAFGRAAGVQPEEEAANLSEGQAVSRFAGAIGSIVLDIFTDESRPFHPQNVAMLYVVGPKGEGCTGPRNADSGPLYDADRFLKAVELLAAQSIETVVEYNDIRGDLPAVEEVRWCLVSGGVYRHSSVSKLEVARATLEGMTSVRGADGLVVTFCYDEDCFKEAFQKMDEA
eukprot:TRINITY_DN106045_c0_g1_i1.p1 TRINITY_DN106045_c0_g1~~TRINITY_DN106045_c0_g1_i1.p1  ORF type:complete len:333 (-),score=73.06 TRINITY_DN106045_c0_g1_i1:81-1079(-)